MSAEAILTQHYEAKRGKPTEIELQPRLPNLYSVRFASGRDFAVVLDGKVFEAKGLDALATYMRTVKLLTAEPALEAGDFDRLFWLFDAYPPVTDVGKDAFYNLDELKRLKPKLERGPDEGRLILNYIVYKTPRGPVANPNMMTVKRWTLEIPKDYKLSWHEEVIQTDRTKP